MYTVYLVAYNTHGHSQVGLKGMQGFKVISIFVATLTVLLQFPDELQ